MTWGEVKAKAEKLGIDDDCQIKVAIKNQSMSWQNWLTAAESSEGIFKLSSIFTASA